MPLTDDKLQIRPLVAGDWEIVRSIYLDGIATGQATFEIEAPTWAVWHNTHLPAPRLARPGRERTAEHADPFLQARQPETAPPRQRPGAARRPVRT